MKKLMKEGMHLGIEYQIYATVEDGKPLVIVSDTLGSRLFIQEASFCKEDPPMLLDSAEAEEFWMPTVEVAENCVKVIIEAKNIRENNKLNPFE